MSIVTVFVSTDENVNSERRLDKGLTILDLKYKLEPITGIPAATQSISLYNGEIFIGKIDNESSMLGAYPVEDYMRIHVTDLNPHRLKNQYNDTSLVEKFELTEDEYAKRTDTVLAFKQRNKLGRFSDEASEASDASERVQEQASKVISIGDRCEIQLTEDAAMRKRGCVRFIGSTSFQTGVWIGVEYDEPLGKNNGTVQGVEYFKCRPNHGAFVRPTKVTVGDFPEEDIFDTDDELEEIMVPNYNNNEDEVDVSAVAWQQHFGLNESNPAEEGQWKEIQQWLQQVAPQFILPACRDTRFLESMKRLRSRHMEQMATDSVVTAFEEKLQVSCQEKEKKLQNQLQLLNIDKEQISTNCLSLCKSLANITSLLGMTDTRVSSIQAAIASMTMERMDLELEKDNFQDHRVIISEKINRVQHTLAIMSRALSSLNEQHESMHRHEISNWKTEMALLERKSEEYRTRAAALQKEYAERKLDENGLMFSTLKDFQQDVEALEQTMEAKQLELKPFLDLPLNIKEAAAKLRSMYDTLDYLKRQRDDLLQSIADSVR
ncbi:unnamed protein product [Umbelopsis vinacea]